MYLVASALWVLALVYTGPFAVVLAAVVALNGQEWYQRALGTEGRIGTGWTIWSTGGRLATLGLISFAIFRWTTGYGGQVGATQFGFGFNADEFSFEAADALRDLPIEGNVLNTTLEQGDALAWRAAGKRKPYLDSRIHLYPRSVFDDWEELRRDIRDDLPEKWRPALDRAKVSVVMLQVAGAPLTYARLMTSPNWVPFHDDGDDRPLRPGRRRGAGRRRRLLQGQPARRRRPGLRQAQGDPVLGAAADADLGADRRDLPEPPAQPPPAPHRGRPALAEPGQPGARGPLPARPGPLHHGDPRGQDRPVVQARRLQRLPAPDRRLSAPDRPGGGPDAGHPPDPGEHPPDHPGRVAGEDLRRPGPRAPHGDELHRSRPSRRPGPSPIAWSGPTSTMPWPSSRSRGGRSTWPATTSWPSTPATAGCPTSSSPTSPDSSASSTSASRRFRRTSTTWSSSGGPRPPRRPASSARTGRPAWPSASSTRPTRPAATPPPFARPSSTCTATPASPTRRTT